jgi:hypothetical protein
LVLLVRYCSGCGNAEASKPDVLKVRLMSTDDVAILKDDDTGCEYLVGGNGQLTPRYDGDNGHVNSIRGCR